MSSMLSNLAEIFKTMASINLELKTKEQVDMVTNAIKQQLSNLKTHQAETDKAILDLELLLKQIQPAGKTETIQTPLFSSNGYNKDWSVGKKAEYVIKKNSRPMGTAEIADFICANLEKNADRKKIVRNLSVTFATQKTRFVKAKNENDENIYSLAE